VLCNFFLFFNLALTALQVKLGEPGFKERYYAEKFKEEAESKPIDQVQRDVVSLAIEYSLLTF
jgi:hypothetical protein